MSLSLSSLSFAQEKQTQTIVLIGDSTVSDPKGTQKTFGWGHFLQENLPGTTVHNLAVSGTSTKSFMPRPEYQKALEAGADIWLIQFGHNDQKKHDPARYTDPATDYRTNLKKIIADAREKGATPILVTSVRRLRFKEGKPTEELRPYAEAVRAVASEENVDVIDLYELSGKIYEGLGPEKSLWITATDQGDYTHFTALGGKLISILVAQELNQLQNQTQEAIAPSETAEQ